MRILVVGAGATGGYFGGRLAEAGRDVTFLVRPARAERLRASGLTIESAFGNVTLAPRLVTAGNIQGSYDVVVLTVKAFGLAAALDDFAPAIGPATSIVPVLNGVRHLDVLDERFGAERVLGGLCMMSATIDPAGRIVHLSGAHDLVYGERSGASSARLAAVDATLRDAGFNARAADHILAEMWQKWISLAALGGITCLMRGTIGDVAAAPYGTAFARAFVDEVVAVAAASGYPNGASFVARVRDSMTKAGATFTSSMYRDLLAGGDVEADQILGDLVARGTELGVPTPLVAAAYTNLKVYEATRSRSGTIEAHPSTSSG